jgi:hypothetical protein
MMSKGETISYLRYTTSAIIFCAGLCLLSGEVLAQEASAQAGASASTGSPSFQAPHDDSAPHLVIAMAEPVQSQFSDSNTETADHASENVASASPLARGASNSGAKVFSLLNDGSDAGGFRYEPSRKNDFRADQWSADSIRPANAIDASPRPLFRVQVGSWSLPVMLAGATQR